MDNTVTISLDEYKEMIQTNTKLDCDLNGMYSKYYEMKRSFEELQKEHKKLQDLVAPLTGFIDENADVKKAFVQFVEDNSPSNDDKTI